MLISYSELCLIGGAVESNIEALVGAGAEGVELMLDGAGWNRFDERMEELSGRLNALGASYSVHVPVWEANLTSECAHIRDAVAESYRRSIEFAAMVHSRYVVVHPGWCSNAFFDKAVARSRSREALLSLAEFNGSYGMPLLVENVGGPAASLFDEEQYAGFLEGFPPEVGYIVDVGHAHMNGWDIGRLLPSLGARLHALHLHDNDGHGDAHAPLGEGSVDWRGVCAAALGTGRDLSLVLELNIGTSVSRLTESKAFLRRTLAEAAGPL
ncbi:MAG: sugar phosphate isomerase/epimerase [Spirochaetes bacterium]|nr:sugar phosphate isomerase/epimerase [Spirochaetota bacterium]MBU1079518.1 sugar phosphate isomerase/epimerase [Spirochaetota bacterium]